MESCTKSVCSARVALNAARLNPTPEDRWDYYESIGTIRQLTGDRMYPLTLKGLTGGMRGLAR